MSIKTDRHAAILSIIREHEIETQEDLAAALGVRGFKVTQATVSRDIRDLKLVKLTGPSGRSVYGAGREEDQEVTDRYIRVLRESFVSMEQAQNLLVIKTASGMAMAAGAALDALEAKEIVGCIAGDDTIMAALRSSEDAALVMRKIRKML